MKIIILEGIATGGKTSVKNKLVEILNKNEVSFAVIEEDETLMPILDNTDRRISINFLNQIIDKALNVDSDIVIIDRLYFTHIFRTNSSVSDFIEIENKLRNIALLVLLEIDEQMIPERISRAREHRDKDWNDYVSRKGNDEEVYNYYINQQRSLLDILKETSLNYKIYNSSNMDFYNIAVDILRRINIQ
jgi:thymidylate kinase